MRAWRNGRRNGLKRLSAPRETEDAELLKFGETSSQVAIPSQALRLNGRREGVETRRAAPKARTRYGEGIVQTTNSSRRERVDEAAQAVAGTKIRWGKPRAGSIPAARTKIYLTRYNSPA